MALPPSVQRHENNLEKCLPKFAPVLQGTGLSPEKLKQTIINSLMANNYLANCSPESVMQSAMTAAVLGLEVDNVTGQGYLTPFKGRCQFIPGYKGYITLARNSGFVVEGDVVREKDTFHYERGLNPKLEHVPAQGSPTERGAITHAYAVAHHNTLPSIFDVVHIEDVNRIRDRSEGYKAYMAGKIKSTPWATDYPAMAKKTAIRALASKLPLNVQKAAAIEGEHERGKSAYIDERGDVTVYKESQADDKGGTTEQPTAEDLGLGDDICGKCGGRGIVDTAETHPETGETVDGKGPCPDCS